MITGVDEIIAMSGRYNIAEWTEYERKGMDYRVDSYQEWTIASTPWYLFVDF